MHLESDAEVAERRTVAEQIVATVEVGLDQVDRVEEGLLDLGRGLLVRADEPDPGNHPLPDLGGHRLERLLVGIGVHALGDAPRAGLLVRGPGPAVVEHPLVAPLVAELLEQDGNEGSRGIRRVDGGFGELGLHRLDDRRRVLHAAVVRRNDERHQGQPGVATELVLVGWAPPDPLVGDSLVAEVGAHLDRVGREIAAEDSVGSGHWRKPPGGESLSDEGG